MGVPCARARVGAWVGECVLAWVCAYVKAWARGRAHACMPRACMRSFRRGGGGERAPAGRKAKKMEPEWTMSRVNNSLRR